MRLCVENKVAGGLRRIEVKVSGAEGSEQTDQNMVGLWNSEVGPEERMV